MIEDPIERINLGLSAGAIALCWAFAPAPFASGVTVGAIVEEANFRALRRGARQVFFSELAGSAAVLAMVAFGVRFGLLAGILAASMYVGMHPVGLVVGLSLIVPSVVIGTLMKRPVAEDLPAIVVPEDASWDSWNPWLAQERDVDPEEDA